MMTHKHLLVVLLIYKAKAAIQNSVHASLCLFRWVNRIIHIFCWDFLGFKFWFSFLIAAASTVLHLSSCCLIILIYYILIELDLFYQVSFYCSFYHLTLIFAGVSTLASWAVQSASQGYAWLRFSPSFRILLRAGAVRLSINATSDPSLLHHTLRNRHFLTRIDQLLEITAIIYLTETANSHV